MWSRTELKSRAKEVLNLNYWKVVLISLICSFIGGGNGGGVSFSFSYPSGSSSSDHIYYSGYFRSSEELKYFLTAVSVALIIIGIVWIIALALSIFIFNPLIVGGYRYFLLCGRRPAKIEEMVFAFSHSYINIVKIMFFKGLYTFLWSLLFIIPGIVKSYEYRMIPYLLAENPELDMKDAFSLTKQMMTGDKANTWVLDLSFIGWELLGAFTCGILNIFYINPYRHLTNAQLYEVLTQKISGPSESEYDYQNSYGADSSSDDLNDNPYIR